MEHNVVLEGLGPIREDLAEFYRDLHRHPELSLHETRTAGLLAQRLRAIGCDEVIEHIGGTGVVGVLSNHQGPVVMLRADIDALPVPENTGLAYASAVRTVDDHGVEVPVMHACGHDMHAACLTGAATLLAAAREAWRGTVLILFQPAEEIGSGARDVIADGLFERLPKPRVVLGQHVGPLPGGFIGHRRGPVMAGSDALNVTVHGRGGHSSRPEAAVNPLLMAANIVTRLPDLVAREVPSGEAAVVTVGRFHSGAKENIIPSTAELGINIRSFTPETRDRLRAAVERIVSSEFAASAATREPELDWIYSLPALVSDPDATAVTVDAFAAHFGAHRLLDMPLVTASEDVGAFGEAIGAPTVFWFFGGLDPDTVFQAVEAGRIDSLPANHSPEFAPLIEPTLSTGVEALVVAALAWLAQPEPSANTQP
jgi:hippurate hydrolase